MMPSNKRVVCASYSNQSKKLALFKYKFLKMTYFMTRLFGKNLYNDGKAEKLLE